MKPLVDWSVFDGDPFSTLTCRCGTRYVSHAKLVLHEGRLVTVARYPCPNCGKDHDHTTRVESPREIFTLRGPDG